MCGEHQMHSIHLDSIKATMSEENRKKLEAAEAKFAEMCRDGTVFATSSMTLPRIQDFYYG